MGAVRAVDAVPNRLVSETNNAMRAVAEALAFDLQYSEVETVR